MSVQVQLTADQRQKVILDAGCALAAEKGLCNVRHTMVADACNPITSVATVRWYFRTNSELWAAITGASSDETVKADAQRLGLV